MPAPDYETVLDVETAVETAAATVLSSVPYSFVTTATQKSNAKRLYPRADVQFALGAEQGHRGEFSPGRFTADAWFGALTITISTARPSNGGMSHAVMRAKARLATRYFTDQFNADILPYHVLTMIKDAGTELAIDADTDTDSSRIHFECAVSVRAGAWPANFDPSADSTQFTADDTQITVDAA